MANTITFTPTGTSGVAMTITPIPGTFQYPDSAEDRGGGNVGQARAAVAASGSVQTELDSVTVTLAALQALADDTCKDAGGNAAGVGEGAVDITGAGDYAALAVYDALLTIEVAGDGVQTATITWKGTAVN